MNPVATDERDAASLEISDGQNRLGLIRKMVPTFFRCDDSPPEATGLALDNYAQAAVGMSSMFLGPALLQLATKAADTACDADDNACASDGRIYGMKPSSLLSNIAVAAGLLGSVLMPLFGAVVDHTPFRRNVGAMSAAFLTLVKGVETMVSLDTWFVVSLLQIVSGMLYQAHTCATYAYTSELTNDPEEQTKYNTYFNVVYFVSSLAFLIEIMTLAFVFDTGDVGTARISQIVVFGTSFICFGYPWLYLFRDRPALSHVPEGSNVLKCGFQNIVSTSKKILSDIPSLKWLFVSIVCTNAATSALATIATTYMSHFMEMDSTEIGTVFFVVLITGIPGCKIGEKLALKYNPLTSAKLCVSLFIASVGMASIFLTGPEAKHLLYVFGVAWGIGFGWIDPMHTTALITIMPKGQETELMGIYIFCGQVLAWMPPLVFTVLNEIGMNMSIGLASLDLFFVAGLCFLFLIGDYNEALGDFGDISVGNAKREDSSDEMTDNSAQSTLHNFSAPSEHVLNEETFMYRLISSE